MTALPPVFQPTPPVGAETSVHWCTCCKHYEFQPAPPVGAETPVGPVARREGHLTSTRSARGGGDYFFGGKFAWENYFNPLRPWGRRHPATMILRPMPSYFNPLRPWGRRLNPYSCRFNNSLFQPTPPVGAETACHQRPYSHRQISTHSARGGGDTWECSNCGKIMISTHSARVGGDVERQSGDGPRLDISTRSARVGGDQVRQEQMFRDIAISTRSARGGGDGCTATRRIDVYRFQPAPPVGAETPISSAALAVIQPISTRSARVGGDRARMLYINERTDFNPLRPCGRRLTRT